MLYNVLWCHTYPGSNVITCIHKQVVDRRVDFEATWQGKQKRGVFWGLGGFSEETTFYKRDSHFSNFDPQKHFTDFSPHRQKNNAQKCPTAILCKFQNGNNKFKSKQKKFNDKNNKKKKKKKNNNNNNKSWNNHTPQSNSGFFVPSVFESVFRGETDGEWEAASPTPSLPGFTSDAGRSHPGSSQSNASNACSAGSSGTTATECSFRCGKDGLDGKGVDL